MNLEQQKKRSASTSATPQSNTISNTKNSKQPALNHNAQSKFNQKGSKVEDEDEFVEEDQQDEEEEEEESISVEEEEEDSEPLTSDDSEETQPWISWFCSLKGNEFFC